VSHLETSKDVENDLGSQKSDAIYSIWSSHIFFTKKNPDY